MGEWNCSSTFSLTSAVDGVGGQCHAPCALPRKIPSTHCTGLWVGPRAGLDGEEISPTPEFDPWNVQPVGSRYADCGNPAPGQFLASQIFQQITENVNFIIVFFRYRNWPLMFSQMNSVHYLPRAFNQYGFPCTPCS